MPVLRFLALVVLVTGVAPAQPTLTSFRVAASLPGMRFTVDGEPYQDTASFLWGLGTTHTVSVDVEQPGWSEGGRYSFVGWIDSSGREYGRVTTVTVTADPSVWSMTALFDAEYSLSLSFFRCDQATPAACGNTPGTVTINGAVYWKDASLWLPAGLEVNVAAAAAPGYVFAGWDSPFACPVLPAQTFVLDRPMTLVPRFVAASSVTVVSSPPGLKVMVDGSPVTTPRTFGWLEGTTHVIGSISPQLDEFSVAWAPEPGNERQVYTVGVLYEPQVVTVRYVRGAGAAVTTEPLGLTVKVDGSDNYPSPYYVWAVGSTHRLAAPVEQTGKNGRRYAFRSWSDGELNPVRQVNVGEAALLEPIQMTARYELLGRLTLESAPAGLKLLVEGVLCVTPCSLDRLAGARVAIVAPATVALGENSRLDFEGWQDRGSRERIWTMTAEIQRLAASYRIMHRVQSWADPAGGARFRFEPDSADGYYSAGTPVVVTAEAQPGFRFRRWGGDLEGTYPTGAFPVNGPTTVVARLDRVPYIAPAGVVNAAAVTPVSGVAPGSVITIYGESLSPSTEAGPPNPLAQTIAGVTVQVSERLLPLFFVSPTQINALLPSDLPPGEYRLTVRSIGMPDISAKFTIVRNAPGLFTSLVDAVPYAAALHGDGTQVLPASPARRGEMVTVLGTGFGPYLPKPPDGFAVPLTPAFPLADPAMLIAGELTITPQWAGAAPGALGVTAVRFQVPPESPGPLQLKAIANGRESNTVTLPVE